MLNISKYNIKNDINQTKYKSLVWIVKDSTNNLLIKILSTIFILFFVILFLPWTQNVRSRGYVTTLHPDQRPQTIHSVIGGRIEKWYVREGNFVHKGDTLLFISETKDQYFDPNLLENTEKQIKAKEQGVTAYMEKVKSLDAQIDALILTKNLKTKQARNYLKQARLKVISDSINHQAAITNYQIAQRQFQRYEKLYNDGLKSLTDFEGKKLKLQETEAKMVSAENKLLSSRNDQINARVELLSIESQYLDKLAKAESDKQSSLSAMYEAESIVTKMQNQYMNYSIRRGLYYITAPQDGYVTKTIKTGIGETVKEGEDLMSIMPSLYDLAIEMYVEPMDLPLIHREEKVRFIFDGWPSVVFSGWPSVSYGTYGGKVVAIDNFISDNGKYRILVAPDENDHEWPHRLRVGSGATGMALLNNVPIWYELWRKLSGFPPDYYTGNEDLKVDKEKTKKKK